MIRLNFAKIFGIRKLRSLGYCALFSHTCIILFSHFGKTAVCVRYKD